MIIQMHISNKNDLSDLVCFKISLHTSVAIIDFMVIITPWWYGNEPLLPVVKLEEIVDVTIKDGVGEAGGHVLVLGGQDQGRLEAGLPLVNVGNVLLNIFDYMSTKDYTI